jgi:hypothetical protein
MSVQSFKEALENVVVVSVLTFTLRSIFPPSSLLQRYRAVSAARRRENDVCCTSCLASLSPILSGKSQSSDLRRISRWWCQCGTRSACNSVRDPRYRRNLISSWLEFQGPFLDAARIIFN